MIEIPTTVKNKALVSERREKLIKSGIKLFGEKGFHGTTLKDLAEDAGISYGNIYDYVGCKEDIFFLIHDFLYRTSMDLFDRCLSELNDPLERLRGIIGCEFKILNDWSDATLLLYQEAHILNKVYLRELLSRERKRLERLESVISECIVQGKLKPWDPRVAANLIKSTLDAWVLKRWDLRGHVSQQEAEQITVNLILRGFLKKQEKVIPEEINDLENYTALIVNGGTVLGKALCAFFAKRGLRVVAHIGHSGQSREYPAIEQENMRVYTMEEDGPLSPTLLERIENENGPLNIYIQDMGVGNTAFEGGSSPEENYGSKLDENIITAHRSATYLHKSFSGRTYGRILFIAPWAWDQYLDTVRYETSKAATLAITETLAKKMAPSGVNVNCILPGYIKSVRPSPLERKFSESVTSVIPRKHLGEIQNVLDSVWFLVGNSSRYITGQVISVSGGELLNKECFPETVNA